MNKKDNTIVIYFDALLKNNENENIKDSELKAKKGIREFWKQYMNFIRIFICIPIEIQK